MPRKKGKASFDAYVKLFLHNYGIPTRKDVEKLMERLDRIEKIIKTQRSGRSLRGATNAGIRQRAAASATTASDTVLSLIQKHPGGISFTDIRSATRFEDKKLRNIIFRLNKIRKIVRKSRGMYMPAEETK